MNPEFPCPGVRGALGNLEFHIHPVEPSQQHSEVVIRTVAALTNQDPRRMTPLATVIDPFGIDRVFDSYSTDSPISLDFEYEGCYIVLKQTHVCVSEPQS